jgi:hypothetical protein
MMSKSGANDFSEAKIHASAVIRQRNSNPDAPDVIT